MSFGFATTRTRRRASLTPMVDVVFLLLVFFMLAARFGAEGAISLVTGGTAEADWSGPPRLLELGVDGLRLNGVEIGLETLTPALDRLTDNRTDPILLEATGGADVQALADLAAVLSEQGFTTLVLLP